MEGPEKNTGFVGFLRCKVWGLWIGGGGGATGATVGGRRIIGGGGGGGGTGATTRGGGGKTGSGVLATGLFGKTAGTFSSANGVCLGLFGTVFSHARFNNVF